MSQRKLKDWLDAYLQYTDNSEPPEVYKKWVGVSCIAAALQRRCWAEWESKIYPNMYVVLVGPSGGARKGTAMAPGLSLLLNEPVVNLSAESTTREALIRKMKNIAQVEEFDAHGKGVPIYTHSSITIFSPELTVFLGYKNEQFLTDLTDWYDCRDPWTYETKNMGVDEILGVCVNMIGATTPEMLQYALPNITVGGGLTSRIIFVYADRKGKIVPIPFKSPTELAIGEDLQHDLGCIAQMRGAFQYTEGYIKRRVDWYIKQHTNPPFLDPKFWGYLERRATHLLKLGMVMSASRDDSMILDEYIFDRSLEWLTEVENKMERVYRGYGRKDYAPLIPNIMRTIQGGTTTFIGLLGVYGNDLDTQELMLILEQLQKTGYLKMTKKEINGKIDWELETKSKE